MVSLLAVLAMSGTAPKHQPVGFVWNVRGKVEFRAPGIKSRRLTQANDRFKLLYNDTQFHVIDGEIEYRFGLQTLPLGRTKGWKTLGMYPPIGNPADAERLNATFRDMEKIAGAERTSKTSGVIFPFADAKVRAGHFSVRWLAPRGVKTVTIAATRGEVPIWGPETVPSARGELSSRELSNALTAQRDAGESRFEAHVHFDAVDYEFRFTVLSPEDDAKVQRELDRLGRSDSAGALLRVEELASEDLAEEACDEVWRLWQSAPKSYSLTIYAYNICSQFGDFARARTLKVALGKKKL